MTCTEHRNAWLWLCIWLFPDLYEFCPLVSQLPLLLLCPFGGRVTRAVHNASDEGKPLINIIALYYFPSYS